MYSMKTSPPPLAVNYSKGATKQNSLLDLFYGMILFTATNKPQCNTCGLLQQKSMLVIH